MFLDEQSLHVQVEDIVWELDCPYTEALLIFCERNQTDIEDIAHLVSSALKTHIMDEAINNGLMNGGARLPF